MNGREWVTAAVATAAERTLPGLGAGTAAFAVDRVGRAAGRPVGWRHTLVRGDRFSPVAQFSPQVGYRVDLAATPHAGHPV